MNSPAAKSNPANLLYRSRAEIHRIFLALVKENAQISANMKNDLTFASRLLSADQDTGYIKIAYSASKSLNAMVLESPSVEFTATAVNGVYCSFEGANPEESQFEGQPAIKFAWPKTLLLHNRREHARIPVPADVSLRCIADEKGVIPFESRITDIARNGLGSVIYDPDIHLEDGTILRGCRIVLPSGDAVIADLQLVHATTIALPDGTLARRAGFRFCQPADDAAKVLNHFVEELGK